MVQIVPDTYWGLEPCEKHRFSTTVRVCRDVGASVPRPQAGRGLLGVKLLLIEPSPSFRRRDFGGKESLYEWTMITTTSSATDRHGGVESSCSPSSSGGWLSGLFASSISETTARRRPLLVGRLP
jgi:hypothetical protein